ncbi:PepSY domain-containing protein [Micromonospora sp. NPDC007230]|uniref:PepSY domain-containing protein n=1 Tax=Micromonospora sp. NPDC007230 TaxID=3364237 RepID=UPI00367898B3
MRRTSLVLAAAGGAAVLAVTGVALGVTAADPPAPGPALAAETADDNPKPDDDATSSGAAPSGTADGAVSGKRAGEIALARLGGGRIVEIEAELEHGRRVWSVKVAKDGTTYEVKVDRGDGTVVEIEQRRADDGRRGDDRTAARSGSDDRNHDVGDDHGGDRPRTGTDDRGDDHGGTRTGSDDRNHDVGDDHGGDRPRNRDDD